MSSLKSVKWNFVLGNPVLLFCFHGNFLKVKFGFFKIFSLFFENDTKAQETGITPEKSSRTQEGEKHHNCDNTMRLETLIDSLPLLLHSPKTW